MMLRRRISWERLAGLTAFAFIGLYIVAFALGIEVGASDREILEHYADSGSRVKEGVAFFVIAAAALMLVVFTGALRALIARAERETAMLAALAWAGGIAAAVLVFVGNALSRAPAFSAMSEEFVLDPTHDGSSIRRDSCSSSAVRSRRSSSSSAPRLQR